MSTDNENILNRFNTALQTFVEELHSIDNDVQSLTISSTSTDELLTFVKNLDVELLSSQDPSLLDNTLIEGLNLQEIYTKITNKDIFWKHLNSLYIVAVATLKKDKTLDDIFQQIKPDKEELEKMKTLFQNMLNTEETTENMKTLFDGQIGSLAKEIADSVDKSTIPDNPADFIGSIFSGEGNGLMNTIFGTIQSKVESGELDTAQLMKEAQSIMGSFGGLIPGGQATMPNLKALAKTTPQQLEHKMSQGRDVRGARKREQLRKKIETRKKLLLEKKKVYEESLQK